MDCNHLQAGIAAAFDKGERVIRFLHGKSPKPYPWKSVTTIDCVKTMQQTKLSINLKLNHPCISELFQEIVFSSKKQQRRLICGTKPPN